MCWNLPKHSKLKDANTGLTLAQNLLKPTLKAKWKKLEPNGIDFSQKVVSRSCSVFNYLPTSGDFCRLLITFANSLDPDQARQNVGPDLDPICLTP